MHGTTVMMSLKGKTNKKIAVFTVQTNFFLI
jgi:hypothetical protein